MTLCGALVNPNFSEIIGLEHRELDLNTEKGNR